MPGPENEKKNKLIKFNIKGYYWGLFLSELDGVRIANLAKHRVFRSTKDEEQEDQDEEKEAHEKQDKFVLEKLFRKTGITIHHFVKEIFRELTADVGLT